MRQVLQRCKTPALALVFVVLSVVVFSLHGLHADEGVVLNMAWQLLSGRELYSQVIEYIPPITPGIIWLTWVVTYTTSYLVVKAVFIVIWCITCWLLYQYMQRQHISEGWIWLVLFGLLATTSEYTLLNHNSLSTIFAIWVALLWFWAKAQSSLWRYAVVGVGIGLVALTLQTKGVALLIVITAYTLLIGSAPIRDRLRNIFATLVGVAMVVVQLFWLWDLSTLWNAFIVVPSQNNYLATTLYTWPGIIWLVICLGWMVYHGIVKPKPYVYSWFAIQVALFASTFNLIDTAHVFVNSLPTIICCGIIANTQAKLIHSRIIGTKRVTTWRAYMVPWLLYLMCMYLPFNLALSISAGNVWTVDITHSRQVINTPPMTDDTTIFAGPFAPGVYYELRKDNPYIYTHNLLLCNDACQKNMLTTLKAEQPDYAFLSYPIMEKFDYHRGIVDNYILSNYTLCDEYPSNGGNWFAKDACQ